MPFYFCVISALFGIVAGVLLADRFLLGRRRKERCKTEFSKAMLLLHICISLILCGITAIGTILGWDVSALAILAGTSLVTDGTWGGLYLWKAKNENRAKYAQQFLRDFAGQHGADVALRAAEIVLKD